MRRSTQMLVACCLLGAVARGAAQSPPGVTVDKEKKTVTVDAQIAPRKLEQLQQIYPIEVVACWPSSKIGRSQGQKAHETLLTIKVLPSAVHQATESLGVKAGKPIVGESKEPPNGPEVNLFLEFPGEGGRPVRKPVADLLVDLKTGKPIAKPVKWYFTGSALVQPDPTRAERVYGADVTGTLIAIFPVTSATVFQSSLSIQEEAALKLEANKEALPKQGVGVKLVIEVAGGR